MFVGSGLWRAREQALVSVSGCWGSPAMLEHGWSGGWVNEAMLARGWGLERSGSGGDVRPRGRGKP